jgi:hypothetical protein
MEESVSNHVAAIKAPRRNQRVDVREVVSGRIVPPSPVQALIKARDGKWYLQAPSINRGIHWAVACQFGFEDAPEGTVYDVVIVRGYNTIKSSPLESIPDDAEVVATTTVQRRMCRGDSGAAFPTD